MAGEAIWRRFAEAIGKPEWVDSPEYKDNSSRLARRDQLNREIEEISRGWKGRELVEHLLSKGVPCGEIYRVDEVFNDPQVHHLGIAQEAETVPYGKTQLVGQPVVLTETPSRIVQQPPERGEHTGEILAEIGYDGERIAGLRERRIV